MASVSTDASRRRQRIVLALLALLVAWFTFWSDGQYTLEYRENPTGWVKMLAGQIDAPWQYRIGVLFLGDFLSKLMHGRFPLRHILAVLDGLFLMAGGMTVFSILWNKRAVGRVTGERLAFAPWIAFGLLLYYLNWVFYFHYAETIAAFACLAVSGALLSGRWKLPIPVTMGLLLLVSMYLASIRTDSGVALNAGILFVGLFPGRKVLPLGRINQIAAGGIGLLAVVGVEYYIKHFLFPQAKFAVSMFLLVHNLTSPLVLFCVIVALSPWFWTLRLARRYWELLESWEYALLVGSAVEFTFFIVVAAANEVRVFVPFCLAVLPISAMLIAQEWTRGADETN